MNINKIVAICVPPVFFLFFKKVIDRINTILARHKLKGFTKLHLACGDNLINGWANIDLIPIKGAIRYDLMRQLPIDDKTIGFIFTEHFIEHITSEQGKNFLIDCHRLLMENGVLRISTPDLRFLVNEYMNNNLDTWSDMGFAPLSSCQMINDGMRLWGHQFLYDREELEKKLKECGFKKIKYESWRKSDHGDLVNLEIRPYHGEIIIEAQK